MGASELVLRAAPGDNVTLVAPIWVHIGILVLDGLQLRGAADVPAMAVRGGRLTMRGCTASEFSHEGVLRVWGGEVIVEDSTLADNRACGQRGGALLVDGGSLVLRRSTVTRNEADEGGAVYVQGANSFMLAEATSFASNLALRKGGGLVAADGSVVLSNRTILEGNRVGASLLCDGSTWPATPGEAKGDNAVVDGGSVTYALPAPPARWVASGFVCTLYRHPCPMDDDDCDPEAQPPLESQLCDYEDPLLSGKTISRFLLREVIDADYPYACAPGHYGLEGDVAGQTSPMCSGPCWAGHECAAGTVTPAECREGCYCAVGTVQSTPCPPGQTGYTTDMESVDECEPCPKGHWCSAGKRIKCSAGTYNELLGGSDQSDCKPCPSASTSGEGATSIDACECAREYYAERTFGTLTCHPCPAVGTNCSYEGPTLETLPLLEGYWRAHNDTSDVRRCQGPFDGSGCIGCWEAGCAERANFTRCKATLAGPYCALCEVDVLRKGDSNVALVDRVYYDRGAQKCLPCHAGSFVPLLVLCGVVLFLCALAALSQRVLSDATKTVRRSATRLRSKFRAGRQQSSDSKVSRVAMWWARHATSVRRRLKVKAKILFTFYQIVTKAGETYLITYPPSVDRTLLSFQWVNLDLAGLGVPWACANLGSFETLLRFFVIAPVAVLAATKAVGWYRRDRTHEQALSESSMAAFGRRASSSVKLSVAFRESSYKTLPMALRVTFFAFPAVSSLAFKAFRCDDLDANDGLPGPAMMSADFSVVCWDEHEVWTEEYTRIVRFAIAALVAYPLCIPLFYSGLLFHVRHAVWTESSNNFSRAVSFLTEEYSTSFFFWELLEVVKKLLLVGVMSVVLPGELNQLFIAFVIVLCFLVVQMIARPYKRHEDDVIALGSSFGLVMFFFFSIILKLQTLTEAVEDQLTGHLARTFVIDNDSNVALLLASTLCALVLGAAAIAVEIAAEAAAGAKEARRQAEMQRELDELRRQQQASAEEAAAMRLVLAAEAMPEPMQRALLDPSALQISDVRLGVGSFGEVWRGTLGSTPVAVKKLHRSKLNEKNLMAFRAEFELQLTLRHPNILQVIGGSWTLEDVNVCIALELCERGTIESLLKSQAESSRLTWKKHKLPMAMGVARGMAYLHLQQPPVIHRDLKPANVLIDDGWTAKIADFGTSREVDLAETMDFAGTPLYAAPELLRRERYDEKVDVWSFACLLECVWTHKQVYKGVNNEGVNNEGVNDEGADRLLRRVQDNALRPQVGGGFLAPLVDRCAAYEATERCTFAEAGELLAKLALSSELDSLPPGPAHRDKPVLLQQHFLQPRRLPKGTAAERPGRQRSGRKRSEFDGFDDGAAPLTESPGRCVGRRSSVELANFLRGVQEHPTNQRTAGQPTPREELSSSVERQSARLSAAAAAARPEGSELASSVRGSEASQPVEKRRSVAFGGGDDKQRLMPPRQMTRSALNAAAAARDSRKPTSEGECSLQRQNSGLFAERSSNRQALRV